MFLIAVWPWICTIWKTMKAYKLWFCTLCLDDIQISNIYHSLIASNKEHWRMYHSLVFTNVSILWIANVALLADHLHYSWINKRNIFLPFLDSVTRLWVRASALLLLPRQRLLLHSLVNQNLSQSRLSMTQMFLFICPWHDIILFRKVKIYRTARLVVLR